MRSFLLFPILAATLIAESGQGLFEKGLAKERAGGDPAGAIILFEKVAREHASERKLVAEAIFRIGECRRALGQPEAKLAYERVVREFADQGDVVERARKRLLVDQPESNKTALSTRRIWTPPSHNLGFGNISADGKYLAYSSYFTTGDLALREIGTGATRQLTNKGAWLKSDKYATTGARISPDGKVVAFGFETKSELGHQLRVINTDGTQERVIYSNPEVQWSQPVGFSADGSQVLAKIQTRNQTGQIAWLPLSGGSPRILKTLPWQALGRVELSADHRYIAYDFSKDQSSKHGISVLAADGSTQVDLTDGSSDDQVSGWMPDGKWVLFSSLRTGIRELWAVPVDGADRTPLLVKTDIGRIEPLGVTRDGSLLYSKYNQRGVVRTGLLDWDTGKLSNVEIMSKHVMGDFGPDFSPDGKYLAYVAHRGTELSNRFLMIHNLVTGKTREVSPKELSIFVTGGNRWSSDGKSFLMTGGHPKHGQGAYAVDVETGEVRLLINRAGGDVQTPDWLPENKSLIYRFRARGVAQDQTFRLFIRDLETREDRQVVTGFEQERVDFAVSPNGAKLAIFRSPKSSSRSMYILPIGGGEPKKLIELEETAASGFYGWTPDNQRIVYTRSPDLPPTSTSVWWISADGGAPHRIEIPWDSNSGHLRFHPDGKRFVYSTSEYEAEVWAIDNIASVLRQRR